jgi:hypothetical protein
MFVILLKPLAVNDFIRREADPEDFVKFSGAIPKIY